MQSPRTCRHRVEAKQVGFRNVRTSRFLAALSAPNYDVVKSKGTTFQGVIVPDPRGLRGFVENFIRWGADDPRALFQNDLPTIQCRHERLLEAVRQHREPGDSLHDIGAGVGDLLSHIERTGLEVVYSATEMVPEVAGFLKAKFPHATVHVGDYLRQDRSKMYEFVVASGMFGNTFNEIDYAAMTRFWQEALEAMFHQATKIVSVNFVSSRRTMSVDAVHYCDPLDVVDFVSGQLSRFWTLDASSPLFEFTVHVYKPAYVRSLYSAPEFEKYSHAEVASRLPPVAR